MNMFTQPKQKLKISSPAIHILVERKKLMSRHNETLYILFVVSLTAISYLPEYGIWNTGLGIPVVQQKKTTFTAIFALNTSTIAHQIHLHFEHFPILESYVTLPLSTTYSSERHLYSFLRRAGPCEPICTGEAKEIQEEKSQHHTSLSVYR